MTSIADSSVARILKRKAAKFAVFLGAGTSASFGYPTTGELLPMMVAKRRSTQFLSALYGDPPGTGEKNRKSLHGHLAALLRGKNFEDDDVASDGLPLVTSLLSLLDFSIAADQSVLPGASISDTRMARRLVERSIVELIRDDRKLSARQEKKFANFCVMLRQMRRHQHNSGLPILTTNYDMMADVAAYTGCMSKRRKIWPINQVARRIDYGFRWFNAEEPSARSYQRPPNPRYIVLKLHGATNWLRCPLCDNIFIDPDGPIWHQAFRKTDNDSTCVCNDKQQLEAVIVSPSFVRETKAGNIAAVWKAALDVLRAADEWLIIGYSFPDEDLAIRALFTRAYGARARPPHITVVQRNEDSRDRYAAFFKPERLAFYSGGVEQYVESWLAGYRRMVTARRGRKAAVDRKE